MYFYEPPLAQEPLEGVWLELYPLKILKLKAEPLGPEKVTPLEKESLQK